MNPKVRDVINAYTRPSVSKSRTLDILRTNKQASKQANKQISKQTNKQTNKRTNEYQQKKERKTDRNKRKETKKKKKKKKKKPNPKQNETATTKTGIASIHNRSLRTVVNYPQRFNQHPKYCARYTVTLSGKPQTAPMTSRCGTALFWNHLVGLAVKDGHGSW